MLTVRMTEPWHREAVEVWNGDTLIGFIYPMEDGICVTSETNPEVTIKVDRSGLRPITEIYLNLIPKEGDNANLKATH